MGSRSPISMTIVHRKRCRVGDRTRLPLSHTAEPGEKWGALSRLVAVEG
jgi:hypothetical protein